MKFPTKEELQRLREQYPAGSRVMLDKMDDVQAPPLGSLGTVKGVDDAGNIMVSWDNGGSLSVAWLEDECHVIREQDINCAGCKWLDQVKHYAPGEGYCCMVVRSKNYKLGDRARYSNMKRCELYEAGDWNTRHEKKEETK